MGLWKFRMLRGWSEVRPIDGCAPARAGPCPVAAFDSRPRSVARVPLASRRRRGSPGEGSRSMASMASTNRSGVKPGSFAAASPISSRGVKRSRSA